MENVGFEFIIILIVLQVIGGLMGAKKKKSKEQSSAPSSSSSPHQSKEQSTEDDTQPQKRDPFREFLEQMSKAINPESEPPPITHPSPNIQVKEEHEPEEDDDYSDEDTEGEVDYEEEYTQDSSIVHSNISVKGLSIEETHGNYGDKRYKSKLLKELNLTEKHSLKKAIVLSEVLGPCKAKR